MNFEFSELNTNKKVFEMLFTGISKEVVAWREREGKWNLLEILCHLYDEEREDFRARLQSVLEHPEMPFKPIDPVQWVTERNYAEQDYRKMLEKFLQEREISVAWLTALKNPQWENAYEHPKVGPISGRFILANWLAHDYLHIRQITRVKYQYLLFQSGQGLDYAGKW